MDKQAKAVLRMDILTVLGEKRKFHEKLNHPFAQKEERFKYTYCFGLAVMAYGHMKAIAETTACFEGILGKIELRPELQGKLIADINDNFDYKIKDVIAILDTREKQYCFIADLYKIYRKTLWAEDYAKRVLQNYEAIFQFTPAEEKFFAVFTKAAEKGDNAAANEAFDIFLKEDCQIPYEILQYIYPEFTVREQYQDITIKAGETVVLDKPTVVNGDILVGRGASLVLKDCMLDIAGSISVCGGRIRMENSRIEVRACKKNWFIHIEKTAVADLEHVEADCRGNCGFISQEVGQLILRDVSVKNTNNCRAVSFSGMGCKLRNVAFRGCPGGAVAVYKGAVMSLREGCFTDCESEYGGAVYAETSGNTTIRNVSFENCRAKYLGAAIYNKYLKLGQLAQDCSYKNCKPEDSIVFNVYPHDMDFGSFWHA